MRGKASSHFYPLPCAGVPRLHGLKPGFCPIDLSRLATSTGRDRGRAVRHHLRLSAIYFAAIALLLRALVPVGWMPNTGLEQHSALMPCPMMGGMMQMPSEHPAKHSPVSSHDSSFCRYGATAHYSPPSQVPVLQPQLHLGAGVLSRLAPAPIFSSSLVWDHAARAPPAGT